VSRAPSYGLLGVLLSLALLPSCRKEWEPEAHRAVDPPVSSPNAIPDAPLNGTIRGAPFTLRDARYFVDHRVGFEHTDIELSAGKSESPCGPVAPARSPSIWLRLEGPAKIETKDHRITSESQGTWSVHYQIFDGEQWVGLADGSAILSIREPGPDGRVSGGLAVCFSDSQKSCVSGSFDAVNCPQTIDQPVRGRQPPESIPDKYKPLLDGGPVAPPASASVAPPSPSGSASAPAGSASAAPSSSANKGGLPVPPPPKH
jgi:hypothetical protein